MCELPSFICTFKKDERLYENIFNAIVASSIVSIFDMFPMVHSADLCSLGAPTTVVGYLFCFGDVV